jgi:4-amino-4-deoxy-L-arabinose transferase-like glycosyltransferase
MTRLRRAFAWLALVLLVAPLLAAHPLVDPDEGLHASIAQEMLLRRDFVTPTFLGEPFLDKPILFFWAEALSLRVFGMNEAAVRVPPLVFGLLGMLTVAALGRAMFGQTAGLIAGIIYASMLMPLAISQVAVHDVGLIPFMCLAMFCLVRATTSSRAVGWGVAMGVCLGLSILTKGLVAVVFVVMFAGCLAAVRREAFVRIAIAAMAGGVVAVAVAAPWYIAMERAHPGYLYYYFIERHLRGYLTPTQRHAGRPWWYYLPIVVGGTLPWSAYFIGPVATRAPDIHRPLLRALWAWCAIGLLFLSLGESKLVTYVLPLFPGFAILIGEYISRVWGAADTDTVAPIGSFRTGLVVQALVLAFLPLLSAVAVRVEFGSSSTLGWAGAALAVPIVVYLFARTWRARAVDAFAVGVVAATIVSVLTIVFAIAPVAAESMTARELARALNALGTLPPRVTVVDERLGSVVFYLAPALRAEATADRVVTTNRAAAIERLRIDPPDAVLAVRDRDRASFERLFVSPVVPLSQNGSYSLFRVADLRAALDAQR